MVGCPASVGLSLAAAGYTAGKILMLLSEVSWPVIHQNHQWPLVTRCTFQFGSARLLGEGTLQLWLQLQLQDAWVSTAGPQVRSEKTCPAWEGGREPGRSEGRGPADSTPLLQTHHSAVSALSRGWGEPVWSMVDDNQ